MMVLTTSWLGIIPVPFKGQRNYIQSADVWNAVTGLAAEAGDLPAAATMIFRKLSSKCLRLVRFGDSDRARRFAEIHIGPSAYALDEGEAGVRERVACPEKRILPMVRLGTGTAAVVSPDFASPIEALVAATKKLHLEQVDPGVKWLVGRFDLEMPLPVEPGDEIEVRLARRLPRLVTVSEVFRSGARLGSVMFSPLR